MPKEEGCFIKINKFLSLTLFPKQNLSHMDTKIKDKQQCMYLEHHRILQVYPGKSKSIWTWSARSRVGSTTKARRHLIFRVESCWTIGKAYAKVFPLPVGEFMQRSLSKDPGPMVSCHTAICTGKSELIPICCKAASSLENSEQNKELRIYTKVKESSQQRWKVISWVTLLQKTWMLINLGQPEQLVHVDPICMWKKVYR